MRTIRKAVLALTVVITSAIIISCTDNAINKEVDGVSAELKNRFMDLGFDASDMQAHTSKNPITGEVTQGYILEKDMFISTKQFEEMSSSKVFHVGAVGEQYRTTNLVSSPRTIRVLGYTGGTQALTTKMRSALQLAVANYNAINTGLNFTLTFGTNTGAAEIVVIKPVEVQEDQQGFLLVACRINGCGFLLAQILTVRV